MGPLRRLLDIHVLYWWHRGDAALSASARAAIADGRNEKYVSAITAWEFITKYRSGKQPEFAQIATDVEAVVASCLPSHHQDPMDRFLIGQALAEDMTIVTAEGAFASYPAKLLW